MVLGGSRRALCETRNESIAIADDMEDLTSKYTSFLA